MKVCTYLIGILFTRTFWDKHCQLKISYLTCWRNLLFLTYITTGIKIWRVISFKWSSICAFSSIVMFVPLSKLFIITNEELTNSVVISKKKYPYIPQTGRFQRWLLTLIHGGWSASVSSSSFRLREICFVRGIWRSFLFSLNFLMKMALWQVIQMITKIP